MTMAVLFDEKNRISFFYFAETIIFASLKIFEQMSSKEKNVKPIGPKKEQTTVLESIRKRTALLVGIVGLALVIFILESLLSSGASIFGGNELSTVGSINGKKIDRNEFANKVEMQLNAIKQQRRTSDVDEQTRGQVIDFVWNQYVNDLVIKPEFDKIGLFIGEDEIYDKVVVNPIPSIPQELIDRNTGKIYEQLAGPMGNLDPNKWRAFVQNASGDQEAFVKNLEEKVKNTRQLEKYSSLIRKGLYVTTAEATAADKINTSMIDFTYVLKPFEALSDSAVKITDADIQKYYRENAYEFMNPETTRKIEYVAFNVMPSPEDLAAIEEDAFRVAAEFKGKTPGEDSALMAQESQNGDIVIQDFTKKTMIVRDSSIFTAAPGTVFGPYNEGAFFKIYKLEAVNKVADSARVRHILVATIDPATQQPTKSKEQARREADSLLTLIKEKKVSFDTLVKTVSDDLGSRDKGGDYGWFNENAGYVEPFKNAGLMGTKKNISIVETVFGYHIIEVLDVSAASHTSYKVAQIFKLIAPSDETNQKVYAQANEFAGKNNTGELFDKAVQEQKLAVRVAEGIKEGDRELPAIDQAREIIRWVYEPSTNKGAVGVFSLSDKHVVVKLSAIKNKGLLPLEDVKEEVTQKARVAMKAEMIAAEFSSKAAGAKGIDDIAGKMGLEPRMREGIPMSSHSVDGFHNDILMGTLTGLKAGELSKPTSSELGVFMTTVHKVVTGPNDSDIKMQQKQLEMELGGRSEYEVIGALKELAEIQDHKARIY
jgi:peptidyl-prolyl cis-trans isomerase D